MIRNRLSDAAAFRPHLGSCRRRRVTLAAMCLAVFATAAAAADHVLLNATFNSETVGAAPGTGGAAVGEPISNDSAIIGLAPFPTPNLRIRDTDTFFAQTAVFGFLNNEEVTTGTVQIRAQVLFTGTSQPEIGLREQGGSAQTFLDLYSSDNGPYLGAYTGNTFHNGLGQFTPNVIVPLQVDASADQKLISVRLNDVALLDRVSIDITTMRGIGTILIGVSNTGDTSDDVMRVDNLRAVACASATFADCLFVDSFDL